MAQPPLLTLQGINLTFGVTPLFQGAELMVGPRERLALVGRNGSGKSTLLAIAAGLVTADRGERFLQPSATIRALSQEPDLSGYASTLAYVEAGLAPGDDPDRARRLLEGLGLTGEENPARLSGGEARRAALARVLAPSPDILLLDEPTNHLDLPAIEWLEETLAGFRGALVLVSHDRRFLTRLSNATVWVDRGRTRRLDQGFGAFEAWRDAILEEEELARHKLDRKIVDEEHWLRYGVSARRKRNQRRLGDLRAMRGARREALAKRAAGSVALSAETGRLSGKMVIEAEKVGKTYGDRAVVRDVSIRVERGDKIGIVGPNGAGKTTLLKLLSGALAPDTGQVRLGVNLEIAALDQGRAALDPEATLADTLTEGRGDTVLVGGVPRHVVGYMKDFLFRPEQARTPVKNLSGGERGRLILARALAKPSNLLLLDEPTNDLDLETLDVLQEMLADYPGTVLLISHDRDFLDRVVGSVLASEGDGRWLEYAGGYADMAVQRAARQTTGRAGGSEDGPKGRPAAPTTATDATSSSAARKKLTFKDQHALKALPERIAALTATAARLERELADPALYGRGGGAVTAKGAELSSVRADLAAAEDEWLRLEMLREALEQG